MSTSLTKKEKKEQLAKIKSIASSVVSQISLQDLTDKVMKEVPDITRDQAIDLLEARGLESEIHDLLVNKITNGAIAIKAFEKLQEKVGEGNLEAIRLVIGFNSKLRPQGVKIAQDLTVNQNHIFLNLDKEAQKLLEANTQVLDISDGLDQDS